MGVLNCNCLHNDTKNINEIITGNNLKAQKLVFALESCKTTLSPRNSSEFFNTSQNNNLPNTLYWSAGHRQRSCPSKSALR